MTKHNFRIAFLLLFALFIEGVSAQDETGKNFWTPSSELDQGRLNTVAYASIGAYTTGMLALNQLWYADFEKAPLHSFDDSDSWLGVDKMGHATSAYWFSRYSTDMLRWAGMKDKKSRYIGTAMGWVAINSFEFYDGFSKEWGFSFYDFAANTAGAGAFLGQDALWGEQRITLKASIRHSEYAALNPNSLGDNGLERLLKDYNGHTYWASINLHSFLPDGNKIPHWLNLAIGAGGDGMIVADPHNTIAFGTDFETSFPEIDRFSQLYVSVDVDLWRLSQKYGAFRTLGEVFGFIKIPAPTLEFSNGNVEFHPLFF
ncbi:MAG: DUF2279 domain-containing protein [Bacteroidota bacterium]